MFSESFQQRVRERILSYTHEPSSYADLHLTAARMVFERKRPNTTGNGSTGDRITEEEYDVGVGSELAKNAKTIN